MKKKILFPLAIIAILAIALIACETTAAPKSDLQQSAAAQQEVLRNAFDAVPAYKPVSFPAREDINWYLKENETRDTWYIYALAMNGQPIFYVVSDMKPRNICLTLTSPQRIVRDGRYETNDHVMMAPTLDGVYGYSGGACNAYYMRDVETGGFIELAGDTFTLVSSKAPLFVETDLRRLQPTE